jgi:hypothetical protein
LTVHKVMVIERTIDFAAKTVVHEVGHVNVAVMHVGAPQSSVTWM